MSEKNPWWKSRRWTKARVAKECGITLLQAAILTVAFALVGFALGYVSSPSFNSPEAENMNIPPTLGDCPQIGAWYNLTTPPEGCPSPHISVNFSTTNIRFANRTLPQNMRHLMLNLEVENTGYYIFDTNPLYWSLLINDIRYPISVPETLSLENMMESRNLHTGERTNGSLVYLVPEGNITYQVLYRGAKDFNMTWKSILPQKIKD